MKRILLSIIGISLSLLLTSCGGGKSGSSANNSDTSKNDPGKYPGGGNGGGSSTGDGYPGGENLGEDTSSCLKNYANPVSANDSCYAYCSLDKSFCIKDDEMPSQLFPNNAVKKCPENTILIDDQCQQMIYSVTGNKSKMQSSLYGNKTGTSIKYSEYVFDEGRSSWEDSNSSSKYIDNIDNYYWQSNIPQFNFSGILSKSGYRIDYIGLSNLYYSTFSFGPTYEKLNKVTPKIIFGDAVLEVADYSFKNFSDWCASLNKEWVKFDEPQDSLNPPQFEIKIEDDKHGGNYITCSLNIDYIKNKLLKNHAPFINSYQVEFDCNYQNKDDCRFYDAHG